MSDTPPLDPASPALDPADPALDPASPDLGPAPIVFRASTPATVRRAGRLCIAAAPLIAVAVALRAAGPGWARVLSDVVAIVGLAAAVAAGAGALLLLTRRGPRLALDGDGFDNRTRPVLLVHGSTRSAPWADVRRLQAINTGGRRLLVLTLADARRSVVVLRRLGDAPDVIEAAIRERLDAANGYRAYGMLAAPPRATRPTGPLT